MNLCRDRLDPDSQSGISTKAFIKTNNLMTLVAAIEFDFKFWAITPAFNINIHSKSFEFEWLFLGIYIRNFKKDDDYDNVVPCDACIDQKSRA